MNTAKNMPSTRAWVPPKLVGVSHDSDGDTEPWMFPVHTLIRHTTLKTIRMASSVPSRTSWVRALSSMPTTQIQVMPMMKTQPRPSCHQMLLDCLSNPNSESV